MKHVIMLACLLVSACVGPIGFQDPGQRAAALSAFRVGSAQLGCPAGQSCLLQWIHTRPAAARLAEARRWDDVADVVMAANYDQDLAWMYLGVAAAGLGYGDAARTYLDRAMQRSLFGGLQNCQPNCDGVDVTATAQNVLATLAPPPRVVNAPTPRRRVYTRRVRPTGEAVVAPARGAPTESETWVPPVSSPE